MPQRNVLAPDKLLERSPYGHAPDGAPVDLFVLRNSHGLSVSVTPFGGIITSLLVPDRHGTPAEIVLGMDSLADYLQNSRYFGAIIGRFANRIAGGRFPLAGKTCQLSLNHGPYCLHGGKHGFDQKLWSVAAAEVTAAGSRLLLSYLSPDGEEGFPGNLSVQASFLVTPENELRIDFSATTDQPTVCSLTHHSYFNLGFDPDGLRHRLVINADHFTPLNELSLPTGEVRPVAKTLFDFRTPTLIGQHLGTPDQQLKMGQGYDHNFVLKKPAGHPAALSLAAHVHEPDSGRVMELWTTAPGLQFYSGNHLAGAVGRAGEIYPARAGFCLEPQQFPDAPNHPGFPSASLLPGDTYRATILYKFLCAS